MSTSAPAFVPRPNLQVRIKKDRRVGFNRTTDLTGRTARISRITKTGQLVLKIDRLPGERRHRCDMWNRDDLEALETAQ